MRERHRGHYASLGALIPLLVFSPSIVAAAGFDFDNGKAPLQLVFPKVARAIFEISPGGNDAPIVLRITTVVANSWFDAIAPYHPTAVGVYSRIGRRPAGESATNRNKNIAILYASYRVLNSLLPQHNDDWRKMLTSVGLDPDNTSTDTTTPIGIGNVAGMAVAAAREHDGMNQLGDEGGRQYNRRPYADYTGYKPVNTAYELIDAGRWQPNVGTKGDGLFQIQQFVTPQWGITKAYSFSDVSAFQAPVPYKSNPNHPGYKEQVDEVLAASAGLTDKQKGIAELFDNKLKGLALSALFIIEAHRFDLDHVVQYEFLTNMASFDGGIATWHEKYRYDTVRPFSAIRHVYGDQPVKAWGGPGKGTVTDLPASQWRSYMNTGNHPEYPSGSSCFCAAHSQASRRYLGSDTLGWIMPELKGSSVIEPGFTPGKTIMLGPWATWTAYEDDCEMARLWGGVHFMSAVDAARELCEPIGDLAYEFLKQHIDGTVP